MHSYLSHSIPTGGLDTVQMRYKRPVAKAFLDEDDGGSDDDNNTSGGGGLGQRQLPAASMQGRVSGDAIMRGGEDEEEDPLDAFMAVVRVAHGHKISGEFGLGLPTLWACSGCCDVACMLLCFQRCFYCMCCWSQPLFA